LDCGLRIGDCGLRIVNCRLSIVDCRLSRLRIVNRQDCKSCTANVDGAWQITQSTVSGSRQAPVSPSAQRPPIAKSAIPAERVCRRGAKAANRQSAICNLPPSACLAGARRRPIVNPQSAISRRAPVFRRAKAANRQSAICNLPPSAGVCQDAKAANRQSAIRNPPPSAGVPAREGGQSQSAIRNPPPSAGVAGARRRPIGNLQSPAERVCRQRAKAGQSSILNPQSSILNQPIRILQSAIRNSAYS
jgi:hypothetical protein